MGVRGTHRAAWQAARGKQACAVFQPPESEILSPRTCRILREVQWKAHPNWGLPSFLPALRAWLAKVGSTHLWRPRTQLASRFVSRWVCLGCRGVSAHRWRTTRSSWHPSDIDDSRWRRRASNIAPDRAPSDALAIRRVVQLRFHLGFRTDGARFVISASHGSVRRQTCMHGVADALAATTVSALFHGAHMALATLPASRNDEEAEQQED